jgi:thiamine-monophosphate kinase
MDEREFVARLKKDFPFRHGLGIGDDASAVRCGGFFQLVSCDVLIEDIHFRLRDVSLPELALKALAVNVSDIAAMGGQAQYFYLGLGFPGRLSAGDLLRFLRGLRQGCRRWQVELAGGDYSRAEKMSIAITIVGRCRKPVLRSGARPGDRVAVTGPLGESALGLRLLLDGKPSSPFVRRHLNAVPQCRKGIVLSRFASSMIDVSDGLLLDLSRLLDASAAGAEIEYEKIPVSSRFKETCRRWNYPEQELVLAGGEDYQLLFTVAPRREEKLRATGIGYRIIGVITSRRTLRVTRLGRPLRLPRLGFDHFRAPAEETK